MKFDKKGLPKEITAFLKIEGIAQAYTISLRINEWLDKNPNPDVNTLICAAHFSWACAELTELDDDIIGFGEEAIELLGKVLLMNPENEEALKNKAKLEKKVKKAKKEREAILEWEKDDIEEMDKDVLSELAFYYFEKAEKSPEFAEKGYRYYQKIYEHDLLEAELPQDALYHFATMTYCKYYAEGYDAAKELIRQTLDWELDEKFKIYDSKVTDVWMIQLNHLAIQNDFEAFREYFQSWYKTMKEVKPDEEPNSYDYHMLVPIVEWLIVEGIGIDILNYILKNCFPVLTSKNVDLNDYELVLNRIRQK